MVSVAERFPRPTLMGVLNVTPDSFSDGGDFLAPDRAVAHGAVLRAEGAHIVDVGGESTRPGARPVDAEEELRRVLPVVEALAAAGGTISIDTSKSEVARRALEAGAVMVNDVTALRGDADLAGVVAEAGVPLCLMHMQGEPRTMQDDPQYGDVVEDVRAFLAERLEAAVAAGVAEDQILLDPGIGFGKTLAHNLTLLRRLPELLDLGRPLMVGASRKSFLGRLTGREQARDRLAASVAAAVLAYQAGATVLRVHDVAETRDALAVTEAIEAAR